MGASRPRAAADYSQRARRAQAARTWVDRVNPFARGLGGKPFERLLGGDYSVSFDEGDAGAWGGAQAPSAAPAAGAGSARAQRLLAAPAGGGVAERGQGPDPASGPAPLSAADAQAAARAATDATRFGELDIITGQPVRDLKMEPVMALKRWLQRSGGGGGGGGGSFDEDVRPRSLQ